LPKFTVPLSQYLQWEYLFTQSFSSCCKANFVASRNPVAISMADGLSVGLGYTVSLTLIASLREILGSGTWYGMSVFGDGFEPFGFMVKAPGAFLCLGVLLGLMNAWSRRRGEFFIQT